MPEEFLSWFRPAKASQMPCRRSNLATIAVVTILSFCLLTAGKAQFTVTGYGEDPANPDEYDVFGTGLASVTSLTDATYNPRGDTTAAIAFTTVSDQELRFQVGQSLSNYVFFELVSASETALEVTYSTTASPGLTIVQAGQDIDGAGGSAQILVETGGVLGTGGAGSCDVFVEDGATFTGTGGGGSNTIYYAPGATVTQNTGGSNVFVPVNALDLLQPIPEPSSWVLVAGGLTVVVLRQRLRQGSSKAFFR